jgi:glutaredoxin
MATPVYRLSFLSLSILLSSPAWALYKVIGSDGKVTYTDRPPPALAARSDLHAASAPTSAPIALPLQLRQATSRYPVTLYAFTSECASCHSARQFLKERGIPFNEKHISSNEDVQALERLFSSREAPVLTIGTQMLKGYQAEHWAEYLNLAGYPIASQLPRVYQYPAPTPLVEKVQPATIKEISNTAPSSAPIPVQPKSDPNGIRF